MVDDKEKAILTGQVGKLREALIEAQKELRHYRPRSKWATNYEGWMRVRSIIENALAKGEDDGR